jgi:hypothetical protein
MTWRKREIMELARECGIPEFENNESQADNIIRFAELVRADERENYDTLFDSIKNWCEAYPIDVFPEPDFKKAHEVLKANGMTLDAISASNMKHVITQVQKMIDAAIRAREQA